MAHGDDGVRHAQRRALEQVDNHCAPEPAIADQVALGAVHRYQDARNARDATREGRVKAFIAEAANVQQIGAQPAEFADEMANERMGYPAGGFALPDFGIGLCARRLQAHERRRRSPRMGRAEAMLDDERIHRVSEPMDGASETARGRWRSS